MGTLDDLGGVRPRRVAYLHIGLPKTGTSYLQNVFWRSREVLPDQGLTLLPERRRDHLGVVLAVRNMFQPYDDAFDRDVLSRLSAEAAEAPGAVLVSHESFAPAKPERARLLLDALGDFEFQVIVTVRDLARQIPSAWQQRIQARETFGYDEFVDAVLARDPIASDFWWNQDLAAVLDRWSEVVDADRIHVVTCPPPGAPRGLLLDRFCSVIGIDPATLDRDASTNNVALGQAQAELVRQVNVALGDRLPDVRNGYGRVGQTFLGDRILRPQGGRPARMPERTRAQVAELTAGWKDFIADRPFQVVGDLADLDVEAADFEPTGTEVSDGELVDVATRALADILVRRHDEMDQREAMTQRVAELEELLARAQSGRGAVRNLARRAIGRRPE